MVKISLIGENNGISIEISDMLKFHAAIHSALTLIAIKFWLIVF